MGKMIDEAGKRYGKLLVLNKIRPLNSTKTLWHCQCDCGQTINCSGSDLRTGRRTSCGSHCNSIKDFKINSVHNYLKILNQDPTPASSFPDKSVHWICEC